MERPQRPPSPADRSEAIASAIVDAIPPETRKEILRRMTLHPELGSCGPALGVLVMFCDAHEWTVPQRARLMAALSVSLGLQPKHLAATQPEIGMAMREGIEFGEMLFGPNGVRPPGRG